MTNLEDIFLSQREQPKNIFPSFPHQPPSLYTLLGMNTTEPFYSIKTVKVSDLFQHSENLRLYFVHAYYQTTTQSINTDTTHAHKKYFQEVFQTVRIEYFQLKIF